ncbi:hypothetical protein DSM106972_033310 [Dulcicalothrix desertica PCC 7102]|uniref:Uncharacterized protein n=1 Tax=Dulcicalothrix desertica PCC 7102 TaxID=232991 RepID=A0A433VJ90_9CYAN|nr:hypothetical protein [Dulcicalothrix desertica]RUT06125.1 hypothetical protein DSM106972_033310 [Dulcicalothrix desertica PCC 7102]TWH54215.1 hypothetical protein CAL7102_02227 [Dulcicalothrix desertica PCC 7102]
MNKKIASIIAGSLAALGSAIVAAPAHAQTTIPVEIEVQPSVYLITYNKLKFLVNENDFLAGGSVSQTVPYDEKTGETTLPAGVLPEGEAASNTISRTVSPLYRVASPAGGEVRISASDMNLERVGRATEVVTMEVSEDTAVKEIGEPDESGFFDGDVTLDFTFPATRASSRTGNPVYSGGELTISVVTP